MGIIEQERCSRFCNDLCRLLQDEQINISAFLAGEIAEEYKKLIDLELEELMHLKKLINLC